jgi:putative endonuclease
MTTRLGMQRLALGGSGERAVARWYVERGGRVLDRNWRCRNGELDLVVEVGRTVVFCEVKARSSSRYGQGFEAVTYAKQQRLRRLALLWLSTRQEGFASLRFDVASVDGGTVTVIEAAF